MSPHPHAHPRHEHGRPAASVSRPGRICASSLLGAGVFARLALAAAALVLLWTTILWALR